MAKVTNLDLEVVDSGTAYTLYAAALVDLAIRINKNQDITESREKLIEYAERLQDSLFRCRIDTKIPQEFVNSEEIVEFLQTQKLVKKISNLLAREHSRRQENIFLFTILFGGIITGELGDVKEATSAARSSIRSVGQILNLPDQVIQQCFEEQSLSPFRDFLLKKQPSYKPESKKTNDVFLVHGHDEASTYNIARFLEKLDLNVIILREQPNSGRTIIEKFIDYSSVRFTIVLLTADDRGGKSEQPYEEQKLRARQNVIFELGFFIGKLGRNRVCALYQNGVEIPSDYSGVLFVPIDSSEAWRLALAREMKAAGLPIDMNKVV